MTKGNKMTVAEAIFAFLKGAGFEIGFTVTGGGAMFLNEAHRKSQLLSVHHHHEQAAAMAAVGYSKSTRKPSFVVCTSGCGSTNTLTGVLDAYQDGVPVLFLSGNANEQQLTETHIKNYPTMRKLGVQENDIRPLVFSITKCAYTITSADVGGEYLVELLQMSVRSMFQGNPGPVWIDVPLNVQSLQVDTSIFPEGDDRFNRAGLMTRDSCNDVNRRIFSKVPAQKLLNAIDKITKSKRPLFLIGNGAYQWLESAPYNETHLNPIPKVFTYLTAGYRRLHDPDTPGLGVVGIKGNRAANYAMQHCDLLIVLGCSLSTPVTGYDLSKWIPNASLLVVDVDDTGTSKYVFDKWVSDNISNGRKPGSDFHADFLRQDVSAFMDALRCFVHPELEFNWSPWRKWCHALAREMHIESEPHTPEDDDDSALNIYTFLNWLSNTVNERTDGKITTIVSDAGSAYYTVSQAFDFGPCTRYVTCGAQADMGFAIPAAIGVQVRHWPKSNVHHTMAITGDGSMLTNVQELTVAGGMNLPIKFIILDNNGYLSIRNTMDKFFNSKYFGTDCNSGLALPTDFKSIADMASLAYYEVNLENLFDEDTRQIFLNNTPALIRVRCLQQQDIIPTVASRTMENGEVVSQPLENMYPFLDTMPSMYVPQIPSNV